jgi:hypothetical protein
VRAVLAKTYLDQLPVFDRNFTFAVQGQDGWGGGDWVSITYS